MVRSILAVIVGYIVLAVLTGGTIYALGVLFPEAYGPKVSYPSLEWVLLNLGYSFVYGVAGGYVTATLAKRSEVKHALALGVLMVILGIISLIYYFGKQPLWYQLGLIVIAMPAAVLGGKLRTLQKKRQEMQPA